jgi:hypothetical protein
MTMRRCSIKCCGAENLRITLSSAGGQYGEKRFRVQLPGATQAEVQDVLSEGEHRCIALAAFLAELSTEPSRSALVLDDPVCSLDHQWRRLVAKRLVDEARQRQVVVFTHDLAFLLDLVEMCEEAVVPFMESHLYRDANGSGICMPGVPWVGMKVRDRIRWLKGRLQEARAVYIPQSPDVYEPLARRIYGKLREAWERAVEEVLLNGAVMRFGRKIQTQRLSDLTDIDDADLHAMDAGMTKASRFIEGHDEATEVNEPVPGPDEVARDIEALDIWVKAIRRRRQ